MSTIFWKLVVNLYLVLNFTGLVQSANILFYFGLASYSHKISVWPLVEELAERGHQITVLSPFPHKTRNSKIVEFHPKAVREFFEHDQDHIIDKRINGTLSQIWNGLPIVGEIVCEMMLKSPDIKEWVKNAKYDLVVIDGLFNECGIGLSYKFKAKFIIFSTCTPTMWVADMVGNVPETSWIPDLMYHQKKPLGFLDKVQNTLSPILWHFSAKQWTYLPKIEKLIKTELDIPDLPPLKDLEREAELVFVTTHYSIEYARALPPIYVPIGGLHIVESSKALPKDLQKFMDESGPAGVVYISFGSYAKASKLPIETRNVLYEVFASFKSTRFIWKFDIEKPEGLPENIMTVNWAPQQEILAHKKIEAFITHGGFLSIQEAVYYGVPLIVFPIFAEQDYNGNLVEEKGMGIKLEIVGLKRDSIHEALSQILGEISYKTRMVELSKSFKDRPMKPLETAVWWTEYILRNKDTSALKPLSIHQTWYERRLLDVWFFLFSIILLVSSTLFYIISKCIGIVKSSAKDIKKHKRA